MKKRKVYRMSAFFAAIMLGALILTGLCTTAEAANLPQKDAILIGYVAPFTGPLAQFTQTIRFIESKALAAINKDGGIYVQEYKKKLPVKIIWADTESNATKASEAATKLVLTDKVDLLVAAWTPESTNPVSAVAERYKIPALMENSPIESWLTGGPYHWAYGDLFYMSKMVQGYVEALDTVKTNKKVGFIFDNQIDGILLAKMVQEKAAAKGYTIIDPGRFPMGTKDYTSIISQFRQAGVDSVIANMVTPDFAVAWRQFHQQGFIPKIFIIGKGMHFRTAAESLGGDLGNGLISEDMWDPSFRYKCSLTGQTAAQLSAEVEKETGKFPDLTIGYDMSTFEVLADVFRRAQSVDREKVRQALEQTNLNTVYGPIKYDKQHIAEMPVVAAQWVKTKNGWDKRIISNAGFPGIPLAKEKLFFLPGSK